MNNFITPLQCLLFVVDVSFERAGNDTDLEYYVRECGDILGISQRLPKDKRSSKAILQHVLFQIVDFKKAMLVST